MPSGQSSFFEDFDLLARQGVVGLFDHFELIEIIRYQDGHSQPVNVFSIAVALEDGVAKATEKLSGERIRLAGMKGYSFGVFRSVLTVGVLRQALQTYLTMQTWKPGDLPVSVGELTPVAKNFVPPDSSTEFPLNRLLKNNFFNGSYILELFDVRKQSLQGFFKEPAALQQLSEAISEIVPLGIAALSDRLGNIIVQFPIEAIRARFGTNGTEYIAELAWHPNIAERKLTITAHTEHDKSTISFGQEQIGSGSISLCTDPNYGLLHGSVWDAENKILLAVAAEHAFINTIAFGIAMAAPEPRTIPTNIDAPNADIRIQLAHSPSQGLVGKDPKSSITEPTRKRVYEEELASLLRQRKFVQYGARPGSGTSDRQRALNDVRSLIKSHGKNGAWLWDPFLAPQDILDTLFHNPTMGAPMRALTLLKLPEIDSDDAAPTKNSRRLAYGNTLSNLPGNFHGLNIEFRSAHGPKGWDFHDRFLIFPKSNDDHAKVWSLGTSVNSLGKSHHILQQVENAQLIADAFQSLWQAVDHCENVIWKCP